MEATVKKNKIIFNTFFCLLASMVFSFVALSYFELLTNWSVFITMTVIEFVILFIGISVYGSSDWNITENWSQKAKDVKEAVSFIINSVSLISVALIAFTLIYLLAEVKG